VIGERFGNYQALSLLGEGGMGAVYLAEHPGIGRKVAIKVLRPELDHDPQLLVRFLNEARAANAIRHPNIIEVLDSGTTAKGASYLVMELLEGESLSARLRRLSRLDERGAIEIAMQTAAGLGAAHAKGIIHRDLKPDNLFIIPEESDASRERVKILDFGIAKLHATSGDSLKTRTGTLMGTPVYMSPEQCLGTREVDHRSDVYSLGIIIYEMLAGRPPFVSEGFGELLNMHLNEAPQSLAMYAPQLSPTVEFVVMRMLAKKAEDRYQSMADVRAALAAATGLPHPLIPEHRLGATDQLGVRATLAAHANDSRPPTFPPAKPPTFPPTKPPTYPPTVPSGRSPTVPPTTLTPAGMESPVVHGTTMRVRRKPWGLIAAGASVAMMATMAAVLLRKSPPAPPPPKAPPANVVETTSSSAPLPPPPARPTSVRIRLDSTPQGARVVRATDGVVLGTTPETIELAASAGRLPLRFEKDGFLPAQREATLDADGEWSVLLQPVHEKPASTPASGKKNPRPRPTEGEPNEPAKL
jgi:eukaryotic-like serine/threonine-protein kinase